MPGSDIKIKHYADYSQYDINSSELGGELTHFKRFSYEQFFGALNLPSNYIYTDYFKKRLHQLSIQGIVRPESLSQYLRNKEGSRPNALKDESKGARMLTNPSIKQYRLWHHHLDAYNSGFLINLNNHLKRNKIILDETSSLDKVFADFMRAQKNFQTGNWAIYKEVNGVRYYLDVCLHGDDNYLINTAVQEYIKELPELFTV